MIEKNGPPIIKILPGGEPKKAALRAKLLLNLWLLALGSEHEEQVSMLLDEANRVFLETPETNLAVKASDASTNT